MCGLGWIISVSLSLSLDYLFFGCFTPRLHSILYLSKSTPTQYLSEFASLIREQERKEKPKPQTLCAECESFDSLLFLSLFCSRSHSIYWTSLIHKQFFFFHWENERSILLRWIFWSCVLRFGCLAFAQMRRSRYGDHLFNVRLAVILVSIFILFYLARNFVRIWWCFRIRWLFMQCSFCRMREYM